MTQPIDPLSETPSSFGQEGSPEPSVDQSAYSQPEQLPLNQPLAKPLPFNQPASPAQLRALRRTRATSPTQAQPQQPQPVQPAQPAQPAQPQQTVSTPGKVRAERRAALFGHIRQEVPPLEAGADPMLTQTQSLLDIRRKGPSTVASSGIGAAYYRSSDGTSYDDLMKSAHDREVKKASEGLSQGHLDLVSAQLAREAGAGSSLTRITPAPVHPETGQPLAFNLSRDDADKMGVADYLTAVRSNYANMKDPLQRRVAESHLLENLGAITGIEPSDIDSVAKQLNPEQGKAREESAAYYKVQAAIELAERDASRSRDPEADISFKDKSFDDGSRDRLLDKLKKEGAGYWGGNEAAVQKVEKAIRAASKRSSFAAERAIDFGDALEEGLSDVFPRKEGESRAVWYGRMPDELKDWVEDSRKKVKVASQRARREAEAFASQEAMSEAESKHLLHLFADAGARTTLQSVAGAARIMGDSATGDAFQAASEDEFLAPSKSEMVSLLDLPGKDFATWAGKITGVAGEQFVPMVLALAGGGAGGVLGKIPGAAGKLFGAQGKVAKFLSVTDRANRALRVLGSAGAVSGLEFESQYEQSLQWALEQGLPPEAADAAAMWESTGYAIVASALESLPYQKFLAGLPKPKDGVGAVRSIVRNTLKQSAEEGFTEGLQATTSALASQLSSELLGIETPPVELKSIIEEALTGALFGGGVGAAGATMGALKESAGQASITGEFEVALDIVRRGGALTPEAMVREAALSDTRQVDLSSPEGMAEAAVAGAIMDGFSERRKKQLVEEQAKLGPAPKGAPKWLSDGVAERLDGGSKPTVDATQVGPDGMSQPAEVDEVAATETEQRTPDATQEETELFLGALNNPDISDLAKEGFKADPVSEPVKDDDLLMRAAKMLGFGTVLYDLKDSAGNLAKNVSPGNVVSTLKNVIGIQSGQDMSSGLGTIFHEVIAHAVKAANRTYGGGKTGLQIFSDVEKAMTTLVGRDAAVDMFKRHRDKYFLRQIEIGGVKAMTKDHKAALKAARAEGLDAGRAMLEVLSKELLPQLTASEQAVLVEDAIGDIAIELTQHLIGTRSIEDMESEAGAPGTAARLQDFFKRLSLRLFGARAATTVSERAEHKRQRAVATKALRTMVQAFAGSDALTQIRKLTQLAEARRTTAEGAATEAQALADAEAAAQGTTNAETQPTQTSQDQGEATAKAAPEAAAETVPEGAAPVPEVPEKVVAQDPVAELQAELDEVRNTVGDLTEQGADDAQIDELLDREVKLQEQIDEAMLQEPEPPAEEAAPTPDTSTADPTQQPADSNATGGSSESVVKRLFSEWVAQYTKKRGKPTTSLLKGWASLTIPNRVAFLLKDAYADMRLRTGDAYADYTVTDAQANKPGVSSPEITATTENKWHYRGPASLFNAAGKFIGKTGSPKYSGNVTYSDALIADMDAFVLELQKEGVDANYKVPEDAAGWDSRHDPLSLYLQTDLSDSQKARLVSVLSPHVRSKSPAVNKMSGNRAADGIFFDPNPTKQDALDLVTRAEAIGGPPLADGVKEYLTSNGKVKASTAQAHVVRDLLDKIEATAKPPNTTTSEKPSEPASEAPAKEVAEAAEAVGTQEAEADATPAKQGPETTSNKPYSRKAIELTLNSFTGNYLTKAEAAESVARGIDPTGQRPVTPRQRLNALIYLTRKGGKISNMESASWAIPDGSTFTLNGELAEVDGGTIKVGSYTIPLEGLAHLPMDVGSLKEGGGPPVIKSSLQRDALEAGDYRTVMSVPAEQGGNIPHATTESLNELGYDPSNGMDTQIQTTVGTYRRVFEFVPAGSRVLDWAGGRGWGTHAGREAGFAVDMLEEFWNKKAESDGKTGPGVTPTFDKAEKIPSESYDFIVINAVFNTMTRDDSNRHLKEVMRVLKPGGQVFISNRSWAGAVAVDLKKGELVGPNEVLTSRKTLQRGENGWESVAAWVASQYPGVHVERAPKTKAPSGKMGNTGDAAVVVTKPAAYSPSNADVKFSYQFNSIVEDANARATQAKKDFKKMSNADWWSKYGVPLPRAFVQSALGQYPEHLNEVIKFMEKMRRKTLAGKLTPRDIAKAYIITVASQGGTDMFPDTIKDKTGFVVPDLYIESNGKARPEDVAGAWLASPKGQAALDNLEEGNYNPDDWSEMFDIRQSWGDDRLDTNNVAGVAVKTLPAAEAAKGDKVITIPKSVKITQSSEKGVVDRYIWTVDGVQYDAREDRKKGKLYALAPHGGKMRSFDPVRYPNKKGAIFVPVPKGVKAQEAKVNTPKDVYQWSDGATRYKIDADKVKGDRKVAIRDRRIGKKQLNLSDAIEITEAVNAAKGDLEQIEAALGGLSGVGPAKLPFIKHLFGFGDAPTIDAVEINYWLTGRGDVKRLVQDGLPSLNWMVKTVNETSGLRDLAIKDLTARIEGMLGDMLPGVDLKYAAHILHHWLWDMAKGSSTQHTGMMDSMVKSSLQSDSASVRSFVNQMDKRKAGRDQRQEDRRQRNARRIAAVEEMVKGVHVATKSRRGVAKAIRDSQEELPTAQKIKKFVTEFWDKLGQAVLGLTPQAQPKSWEDLADAFAGLPGKNPVNQILGRIIRLTPDFITPKELFTELTSRGDLSISTSPDFQYSKMYYRQGESSFRGIAHEYGHHIYDAMPADLREAFTKALQESGAIDAYPYAAAIKSNGFNFRPDSELFADAYSEYVANLYGISEPSPHTKYPSYPPSQVVSLIKVVMEGGTRSDAESSEGVEVRNSLQRVSDRNTVLDNRLSNDVIAQFKGSNPDFRKFKSIPKDDKEVADAVGLNLTDYRVAASILGDAVNLSSAYGVKQYLLGVSIPQATVGIDVEGMVDGFEAARAEVMQPSPSISYSLQSDEFRSWFGDSKIVNPDGTPMVVYHGGNDIIGEEEAYDGEVFRRAGPGRFKLSREGSLGAGIYFTPRQSGAAAYARMYAASTTDPIEGAAVTDVYLSIKKPLVIRGENHKHHPVIDAFLTLGMTPAQAEKKVEFIEEEFGYIQTQLMRAAIKKGYDGIMQYDRDGNLSEIVAFAPEQVKSATDNRGTYSPTDPDIRRSLQSESVAETLYDKPFSKDFAAKGHRRGNDNVAQKRTAIHKAVEGLRAPSGNEGAPANGSDFPASVRNRSRRVHAAFQKTSREISKALRASKGPTEIEYAMMAEDKAQLAMREHRDMVGDTIVSFLRNPDLTPASLRKQIDYLRKNLAVVSMRDLDSKTKALSVGTTEAEAIYYDHESTAVYKVYELKEGNLTHVIRPLDVKSPTSVTEGSGPSVTQKDQTPLIDFMERINASNELGSTVFTEVVGVTDTGNLVTKQPYVSGLQDLMDFTGEGKWRQEVTRFPEQREALLKAGFHPFDHPRMKEAAWVRRDGQTYILYDMHGGNVQVNEDGRPFFVDTVLRPLNAREQATLGIPPETEAERRGLSGKFIKDAIADPDSIESGTALDDDITIPDNFKPPAVKSSLQSDLPTIPWSRLSGKKATVFVYDRTKTGDAVYKFGNITVIRRVHGGPDHSYTEDRHGKGGVATAAVHVLSSLRNKLLGRGTEWGLISIGGRDQLMSNPDFAMFYADILSAHIKKTDLTEKDVLKVLNQHRQRILDSVTRNQEIIEDGEIAELVWKRDGKVYAVREEQAVAIKDLPEDVQKLVRDQLGEDVDTSRKVVGVAPSGKTAKNAKVFGLMEFQQDDSAVRPLAGTKHTIELVPEVSKGGGSKKPTKPATTWKFEDGVGDGPTHRMTTEKENQAVAKILPNGARDLKATLSRSRSEFAQWDKPFLSVSDFRDAMVATTFNVRKMLFGTSEQKLGGRKTGVLLGQNLGSSKLVDAGWPDTVEILKAMEVPEFANLPTSTVVSAVRFDLKTRRAGMGWSEEPLTIGSAAKLGIMDHPSYAHNLPGVESGRLEYPVHATDLTGVADLEKGYNQKAVQAKLSKPKAIEAYMPQVEVPSGWGAVPAVTATAANVKSSLQSTDISMSGQAPKDVWWMTKAGLDMRPTGKKIGLGFERQFSAPVKDKTHEDFSEAWQGVVRGHVNHDLRAISIDGPLDPFRWQGAEIQQAAEAAERQLRLVFPEYEVHRYGSAQSRQPEVKYSLGPSMPGQDFSVVMRKRDLVRRSMQDKFDPIKKLQRNIVTAGGVVDDDMDVYMFEQNFHGKVGKDLDRLQRNYVAPMMREIRKSGMSRDYLDRLLIARHAKERNEHIRDINPEFNARFTLEDGSTLDPGGSGMSDEQAEATIKEAKASGDWDRAQGVFAAIDRLNDVKLKMLVRSGMMSKEVEAELRKRYPNYVPLVGHSGETLQPEIAFLATGPFDPDGAEAVMQANTTRMSVSEAAVKRALGRTTLSESPIIASVMLSSNAAVLSRRNEVAQSFLKLVYANPAKDYWEIDKRRIGYYYDKQSGEVRSRDQAVNDRYRESVVDARVNGELVSVYVKDKAVVRAMNNLGATPMPLVLRIASRAMRFFSAVRTQYNPVFVPTNFIRDLLTAAIHTSGEIDNAFAANVLKNSGPAALGVYKYERWARKERQAKDTKPPKGSKYWVDMLDRMESAGGRIAFYGLEDFTDKKRELDGMIQQSGGTGGLGAIRVVKGVFNLFSDVNAAAENGARLAAFAQAVERGWSDAKAADLARNLTVNFNRKGEVAGWMGAFYAFYNASVQGNTRMLQSVVKHKGTRRIVGGIMSFSAALSMFNYLFGGEDEDGLNRWASIPANIKARNLIILLPNGDQLSMPLPWGYNVFHAFGTNLMDSITGAQAAGSAGWSSALAVADSFNPIGQSASVAQQITPTMAEPIVQWGENTSWHGGPIYKEPLNPALMPHSRRHFDSASVVAQQVSYMLNDFTGGNKYKSGRIDWNPEGIDHIADAVLGAAGGFVSDVVSLGAKTAGGTGKGPEVKDIPFVNKFYRKPSDWAHEQDFHNIRIHASALSQQMRKYTQEGMTGDLEGMTDTEVGLVELHDTLKDVNTQQKLLEDRAITLISLPEDKAERMSILNNYARQMREKGAEDTKGAYGGLSRKKIARPMADLAIAMGVDAEWADRFVDNGWAENALLRKVDEASGGMSQKQIDKWANGLLDERSSLLKATNKEARKSLDLPNRPYPKQEW